MTHQDKIAELSKDIYEKKQELMKLRAESEHEAVEDYTLLDAGGDNIKLSELFGDKQDLLVVHNMGKNCPYCTLWADGFVSLLPHITDRTAFVVVSPDAPDVQQEFAKSRGWPFQMLSAKDSSFTTDMGFQDDKYITPGVSAFYKDADGKIYRTNKDVFGPGDDYSAPWHLFTLLNDGVNDWQPKLSY